MKLLHESVQVTLNIPHHVDETLRNLGYDAAKLYQRQFLEAVRCHFDTIDNDVPVVKGCREQLEQEVRALDEKP